MESRIEELEDRDKEIDAELEKKEVFHQCGGSDEAFQRKRCHPDGTGRII